MVKINRSVIILSLAVFLALLMGTACASKLFVRTEVATLDKKVEDVQTAVEENQKRLQEHDERLTSIGTVITQHDSQFKAVEGKIEEVKLFARGTLLYKETIRNREAKFKFDSSEIGAEAKATLDVLVQKLVADNRGVQIEIQGHTDNTGPEEYNILLGNKRAEAVKQYLYREYHVPLHRMSVISFGSTAPVAENSTSEGRAQNRRVEILVYE